MTVGGDETGLYSPWPADRDASEPKASSAPEWITRQQVADHLGVSVGTVDRWRKTAGLPCVKRASTVRFDRRAVDAWMADGLPLDG